MPKKPIPMEKLDHGLARYRRGCKCELCLAANADRVRQFQRRKFGLVLETVDAEPVRIHVKQLNADGEGMPLLVIAERADVNVQVLYRLLRAIDGHAPTQELERDKAKRILAVEFDPLPKGVGAHPIGARRRLEGMHRRGWSWSRLQREIPIGNGSCDAILSGEAESITWEVHFRIAAFYDRFWLTDGGDTAATNRAREQRMVPVGGWGTNIDEWRAEPDPGVDWAA